MDCDVVALPAPGWVLAHTEPNVAALLELLSAETQALYRVYLAQEVCSLRPSVLLPCWRAFDRANCEVLRRNKRRAGR
jgi:hypothetical protein